MQHTTNATTDTQEQATSLQAAGAFALQRHAEARARAPKRSAATYLRLACSCARQMAKLAPRHPELWASAQALVIEVIAIARQHEAELFATGSNQGAAYIGVWIAAEALQIQLADRAAQFVKAADSDAHDPTPAPDQTAAPPLAASRAPFPADRARLAPASDNTPKSRKAPKWQRPRQRDWR